MRELRETLLNEGSVRCYENEARSFLDDPDHYRLLVFGTRRNNHDLTCNRHRVPLIRDFHNDPNLGRSQLQAAFVPMHGSLMTAFQIDET
jgi:hypothetical protein